jgi:chromosome segregation ATPase
MPEKEKKAKFKLENLQVFKVDLVDKPATGDEFLALRKAQTEDDAMRKAMSTDQFNEASEQTDGNITVSRYDVVENEEGEFTVDVPEGDGEPGDSEIQREASSDDNSSDENKDDNVSRNLEKGEDQMDEIKEVLGKFTEGLNGAVERLGGIADKFEKAEPTQETITEEGTVKPKEESTDSTERSEESTDTTDRENSTEQNAEESEDTSTDDFIKRFDGKLDEITEKIGEVVTKVGGLEAKLGETNTRVDEVERSLSTSSAQETDDNEDPTERSEESFWGGVLGPIGKAG